MIELRVHGRGGQGAVVACELLAQAAFLDGKEPQSFPFFGVERRGAPVTAYARIDDRPIRLRTAIEAPDVVVVLDAGLLRTTPVTDGIRPGGLLLVNTAADPASLPAPRTVRRVAVDATRIAIAHRLGSPTSPIVNTAVLGALARATEVVSRAALGRAVDEFVPAFHAENRAAVDDGFEAVRFADPAAPSPAPVVPGTAPLPPFPEGPVASVSSRTLRTAAWRTLTPVLRTDRCTRCNFCWKFCPDDAIGFDSRGYPVIRLDYCKGCGICATECPPKAIDMVALEGGMA